MNDNDMPDYVRVKVDKDMLIYGDGFAEHDSKGNWKHVPHDEAQKMMGMNGNENKELVKYG